MKPIKVFVSYAHRDNIQSEVGALVAWLNAQENVEAISDHRYADAPPPLGWQAWMLQGIEDAEVVLCICGKAYKQGFEKREGAGKGVAYEGAIVTTDLYRSGGTNEKFYPILPQAGLSDADLLDYVPTLLEPWNNHIALAERERILALLATKQEGKGPNGIQPPDADAGEKLQALWNMLGASAWKQPEALKNGPGSHPLPGPTPPPEKSNSLVMFGVFSVLAVLLFAGMVVLTRRFPTENPSEEIFSAISLISLISLHPATCVWLLKPSPWRRRIASGLFFALLCAALLSFSIPTRLWTT